MKLLKLTPLLLFILLFNSKAEEEKLDSIFLKKPESLNQFDFRFPEYKLDFLSNGMKLYLVPDNRQEITNLRLMFAGGSAQDGNKPGLAELTANLLLKGTKNLNSEQLAEKIDFYGASIYANANDDYIVLNISTLTKYLDEILELTKQILIQPKFDEDELSKLKKQYKASIISNKFDPSSLASNLSRRVIYGKNHPYANFATEKSIDEISIEDIKKFYSNIRYSNNMSLAIYGFYNDNHLKNIYHVFNDFKKIEELELKEIPETTPLSKGIYFIEREGAVQSTIRIVAKGTDFSDKEYETLAFNSNIIGSSFIGRLFKTLREEYSYTYSPSAGVSSRKYDNYFSANADVKEDVTDSAIIIMKQLITDLANNDISTDELESVKKYRLGSYMMSFESSDYLAALIQNAEIKGLRAKNYESYINRIESLKSLHIKRNANDFLKEEDLYIIVVGPNSVKDKLSKLGQVFEYNKEIKPIDDFKKVKYDAEDLLDEYIDAIGDDDVFDDIKTLIAEGSVEISAQGNVQKGTYYSASNNKQNYTKQDFSGATQERWINEKISFSKVSGILSEEKTSEFELIEIMPFSIFNMTDYKFKLEVLGARDGEIYLKVSNVEEERIYKFDEKSFLLNSYSTSQDTPMGNISLEVKYQDYKKYGDYLLPTKIINNSSIFNSTAIIDYKVNREIDPVMFNPEK